VPDPPPPAPFAGAAAPSRRELAGRWCTLEPLDAARHAAGLRDADLAGDEGTWRWLPYGPYASDEEHRASVARMAAGHDPLVFAVVVDRRPAGVLSFLEIVPEHGTIEIGHLWFSTGLQRTTAATEAVFLLLDEAFALGNRRVEWKTDSRNAASRRAAERLGFAFEGIFRQHRWVKGENRDTAWFSLLDREWPAIRAAFAAWLDPATFDADGRQRRPLAARQARDRTG
jgi:RimJ/RimL family protein N-acetyltransferase